MKQLTGTKLYTGGGPNPRRVQIFMAEKGIELSTVMLDFDKGEQRKPEFLALNSLGQVPVLELDDGTIITESVAICRYLECLYPDPPLFGAGPIAQANIAMWNRRMEFEIFRTIGDFPLHTIELFKERIPQFPEFGERQREAAPQKWAWLDQELADGRPFIAGDAFSLADVTGMAVSWLGELFGIEIPPSATRVRRWNERVRARPSWNV